MRSAKLAGRDIVEVKRAVTASKPVIDKETFARSSPEYVDRLAELLDQLEASSVHYRAAEVLGSEQFDPQRTYFEVNAAQLKNMIASEEESLVQQREIGALEAGED